MEIRSSFSQIKKTFMVDLVVNKQNKYIVSFGKDISKVCNVSTTKHLASVMMLDVMASNRKKMPPVWFDVSYRLTADYILLLTIRIFG